MRAGCFFLILFTLRADDLTKKMTARVSEEAEAFQKLAPEVLGEETLHQRSLKPSRFHPRVGNAPAKTEWQERTIVSEYGFTAMADPGSGSTSLHELRKVISVDGKRVEDQKKAQDALAKAITETKDERKKDLLKQFEKYGLTGAVTDYGQALLLFIRRGLERYEFTTKGSNSLNGQTVQVFGYRQIDGPETITFIDEKREDVVQHMRIEGDLWVRSDNFVPVRIVMVASQGQEPNRVKEEAAIDYAMSEYGALLPVKTEHRETRGGKIVAENQFTYANFKKFGASSGITFQTSK